MKRIKILLSFYSKNIFAVCLLFVLMTFSLFFVSNAIGKYRYAVYSRIMYQNSGLKNAVYYMPLTDNDRMQGINAINEKMSKIRKSITEFHAVDDILDLQCGDLGYNGKGAYYLVYDKMLNKSFPLNLSEGVGFSDDSFDKTDSSKTYDVIVGGSLYNNVPVNSEIPITLFKDTVKTNLTVHVIGKLSYPPYTPDFGVGGNGVSADTFLSQPNVVLFQKTPHLTETLNKNSTLISSMNVFVKFSSGASKQEINQCLSYLQENGMYSNYNEIMTNTDAAVRDALANNLPAPLFFLFVATISLISVSVLMVYKKMQEHSIYYLCGLSRKKSFLYMALGIGMISFFAGVLNVLFIVNYQFFVSYGILDLGKVIIDQNSILYIVGYIVAVILLAILLPFLVFRKESPIEFYRRKE